jgi:hypothetical protein
VSRPKTGCNVTRLSDNLMAPKAWVAEIHEYAEGTVRYAVQFVGQDEGKAPTWRQAATVRAARKAIKTACKRRGLKP